MLLATALAGPASAQSPPENESPKASPDSSRAYGLHAHDSYRPNDPSRPTLCLVHGLNSSADVFVHWVTPLVEAGYGIVVYEYPYNRDLDLTAPEFARHWREFRTRHGETRPWSIASHSMGALLAREYVEGTDYRGDVSALLLVAPPNHGSAIAGAQSIVQILAAINGAKRGRSIIESWGGAGLGESTADMIPGSGFLNRLNARPRRPGVAYAILAGDSALIRAGDRTAIEARIKLLTRIARRGAPPDPDLPDVLDVLTDGSGDGCVAIESTRLDGVADHTTIHSDHLELIRAPLFYPEPGPVAAMPWLLERLRSTSSKR